LPKLGLIQTLRESQIWISR